MARNSGQMAAVPARAASTCSHDVVPAADLADAPQRIEAQRRRRARRGADEARPAACRNVGGHGLGQAVGPHGPLLVDLDAAKLCASQSGDAESLFDRGMGLGRGISRPTRRVHGILPVSNSAQLARAPGSRTARPTRPNPGSRRRPRSSRGTAPADRMPPRANPARAFPVPCRPDWSTKASPARPSPRPADRRGSKGPNCCWESRRRNWATASA